MKNILIVAAALFLFSPSIQADIVWNENFDAYGTGDSVNGEATANGDGLLNTLNSVAVDADGQLLHDANLGTERTWISSNTDVLCGCFSFDIAVTGAPTDPVQDRIFVQLLEGPTFSTTGDPAPNFNFNFDVSQTNVSTDDSALSDVKVYFNVSGEDFTYIDPTGSSRTLTSGLRQHWVDGVLIGTGSSSAHTEGLPSAVNTIAFATFNNQADQQFHFDNMQLESFPHAVPEPSGLILIGLAGFVGLCRRKK